MKRHSNSQMLAEAQKVAQEHGLFVTERSYNGKKTYRLFRRLPTGNTFIGSSTNIAGLRRRVFHAAGVPLREEKAVAA